MRFEKIREFFRWLYRYRSIRLTQDGTRFVLLTLAIGVAAINTGNNLLYLLLAMMLSLIVMSGILSEQCLRQLEIQRLLPREVFANRPATGGFSIANRKPRLPTFSLRVMDVVGSTAIDRGIHLLHLPPQAVTIQSYPLLISQRGLYRLDGVKLLTKFPFGLFLKAANLPLKDELVVYPEIRPLPESLVHDLTALGHEQSIPRRGPGVALYNLRGYQAGDESRAIHWKTSARQARLMVKETEAEDQRHVTLALPTAVPETEPARFEKAVALTASLMAFFHEQGYAISLILEAIAIPHDSGQAHLHRLFHALALCQPSPTLTSTALPDPWLTLGERTGQGDLTLLVLPWDDPRLARVKGQVNRVVTVSEAL
ncbi:MAG: DUF58 domain-containing protein [Nitrospirae bacterium]|nr:MAG: DUF58 domain-containing protein [Nitrospirota bacterium]